MIIKTAFVLFAVMLAGAWSAAPVAAPVQDRPGQPTQGKVWIENRGRNEAIPVTIVPQFQGARPDPLAVQVLNIPTVSLAPNAPIQVRAARQTWEYRLLAIAAAKDPTAAINSLGADGYEAVGIVSADTAQSMLLLKRPR
jgi:hypothetical protein